MATDLVSLLDLVDELSLSDEPASVRFLELASRLSLYDRHRLASELRALAEELDG